MRASRHGLLATAILITAIGSWPSAQAPIGATGTWSPTVTPLASVRTDAAAVRLRDGRVLITGGSGAAGPLNTAERISATAGLASGGLMKAARSRHIAVLLPDGRVLAAGGVTTGGAITRSAEIYNPTFNLWANYGSLYEARAGAVAVVLQGGKVLIAGGEQGGVASSSVEVFDPARFSSTFVGSLSAPRTQHAAALLPDGRVLIAGGSDGTAALASADIYDPETNTVSPTGPLSTARAGLSATALLDGTVLVAGGATGATALTSAEIYNPATGLFTPVPAAMPVGRRDHVALLLPSNGQVLLAGGTSSGVPLASAVLYTPWTGEFGATGSLPAPRTGAAAAALAERQVLVAGGSGSNSAAAYSYATVKTDRLDYAPGETVTITGSGWQPGERVTLTLDEFPNIDVHAPLTAVADASGTFVNTDFAPDAHDKGVLFALTATGTSTRARTMFSDSVIAPTTTTMSALPAVLLGGTPIAATGLVSATTPVPDGITVNLQARIGGCSTTGFFTLASVVGTTGNGDGSFSFAGSVPALPGTFGLRAHFSGASANGDTWLVSDSACQTVTIANSVGLTVSAVMNNGNGGTVAETAVPLFVDGQPVTHAVSTLVAEGAHTVSAGPVPGYTVTFGGACAADGSVVLTSGSPAACVVTLDDVPPQLTLNLVTSYTHGGTAPESSWTMTAAGPTPLAGPGAAGATDVTSGPTFSAGTYTLSQSAAPTGYVNGTFSCAVNGGVAATTAAVTLAPGDVAGCTVTNTDANLTFGTATTLGALASPQIGGAPLAAAGQVSSTPAVPNGSAVQLQLQLGGCFTSTFIPTAVVAVTTGGTGSFVLAGLVPPTPGTYGLRAHFNGSASNGSTWSASDSACQTVTVVAAPKLTVTTVVQNNNGGTLTAADFATTLDGNPITSGVQIAVAPGGHTVASSGQPGYSTLISGDCASNGSVTLAAGEVKSCSVTHSDTGLTIGTATTLAAIATPQLPAAPLSVAGSVAAAPGVPAGSAVQLQLQIGGCLTSTFVPTQVVALTGANGAFTLNGLVPNVPGTYGLRARFLGAASGPSTWAASDSACQAVTVTAPPRLTVTSVVVNNNGGTLGPADFAVTLDGAPVTSGVQTTVAVGAHTVASSSQPGYTTVFSGDCALNGSITLAAGDVKSCTVTNTDSGLTIGTSTALSAVAGVQLGGAPLSAAGVVTGVPAVPNGAQVVLQIQFGGCLTSNFTTTQIVALTTGGTGAFTLNGVVPNFPGTYGIRARFAGAASGPSTWTGSDSACQTITVVPAPKLTVTTAVVNNSAGTLTPADFTATVDGNPVVSGVQTTVGIGAHTVGTSAATGYTTVIGGDCAADGTITLAGGDVKSCTVTHTDTGLPIGTTTTLTAILSPLTGGAPLSVPGLVTGVPAVPNGATVQLQLQFGGCLTSSFSPTQIVALTGGGTGAFTLNGLVPNVPGTYGIRARFAGAASGASHWSASDSACQAVTVVGAPRLTVQNVVVNNNGGTKSPADFTVTIDGSAVTAGVPTPVTIGGHAIGSSTINGYTTTFSGDCAADGTITLAAGDAKSCTVTNTDTGLTIGTSTVLTAIPSPQVGGGPLSVAGVVTGVPAVPNGATVQLQIQFGGCLTSSFAPTQVVALTAGGTGAFTLNGLVPNVPGTYGLRAHFAGAASGASTWGASNSACQSVTVVGAPKLTVQSVVVNTNGGTKSPADFTVTVDGSAVTAGVQTTVGVGTHTVASSAANGYTTTFSGDCAADGTVTLAAGQAKSCTVTNTDTGFPIATVTTLGPIPNPQIGGAPLAAGGLVTGVPAVPDGAAVQLQLQIGGCAAPGFTTTQIVALTTGGNGTFMLNGVVPNFPGTYGIRAHFAGAASGARTWNPSDSTCQVVTVAAAPRLTVTTVVLNTNGGTKTPADFALTLDGAPITSGTPQTVSAGAHLVAWGSLPGYTTTISGDCAANGGVTLAAGDVKSCTVTHRDGAVAQKPGNIRVFVFNLGGRATIPYTSNFGVTSLTTPGIGFTRLASRLTPGGGYAITQGALPAGWTAVSASCTNGTPSNITVLAGKTTFCTFINRPSRP